MSVTLFDPIAVGDVRPISVRVVPSDEITATLVTYTATRYSDPPGVPPWDPGGACRITNDNKGTTITTPTDIDFARADTYYFRFSILWADGQIDNTVVAQVPVQNPAGGCC